MSFTLSSSAAIVAKAGANANATAAASYTLLSNWCDDSEGEIIQLTRRDWITSYSNLADGTKKALAKYVSSAAAKSLINYDMSGYTSRMEAQTMLDKLTDDCTRLASELKDFKSGEIKSP